MHEDHTVPPGMESNKSSPHAEKHIAREVTEEQIEAWRADIRRAAAFGIDIPLVIALLDRSPIESIRVNDEALEFFAVLDRSRADSSDHKLKRSRLERSQG